MRTSTTNSAGGIWPTRVIIIDDHEITRAACTALLRAEGIDVVADLGASGQAITAARTHRPDVAIIDVTPAADTGFGIAGQLHALPIPPIVILTSSTDRTRFGARLDGHLFIAKADICAAAIAPLSTTPKRADHNHQIPAPPPTAPGQPATTNAVGQRSGHAQRLRLVFSHSARSADRYAQRAAWQPTSVARRTGGSGFTDQQPWPAMEQAMAGGGG